jgi:hypothetical protein
MVWLYRSPIPVGRRGLFIPPDLDPGIGTEDVPLSDKEQRMVLFT